MKLKQWIVLSACLTFSSVWADMFCPANFNSISMGDSLSSVLQVCGNADATKKYKKTPQQPQEWVYYVASSPGQPGTLKTTVAFDASGKVINISVNGAGVSETQICGATPIQFGDTQDSIEKVCGKPSYINQSLPQNGAPQAIEITELQYNATPSVTLVFEDGKLTERR